MGGASFGEGEASLASFRTRASENFLYIVVAFRGGGSMIIGPKGHILAEAEASGDCIVAADVDLTSGRAAGDSLGGTTQDFRARLFRARNPAAYRILTDDHPPALNRLKDVPVPSAEEASALFAEGITTGTERFYEAERLQQAGEIGSARRFTLISGHTSGPCGWGLSPGNDWRRSTVTPSAAPTRRRHLMAQSLILVVALLLLPGPATAQPQGRIVFVSSRDGQFNKIWVMNANGSAQTQLSFGTGNETDPAWSPDGESIVFVSNPVPGSDGTHITLMDRHGQGMRNITTEPGGYRHPQFSPDGTQMLFSKRIGDSETELFVIGSDGGERRHLPMPLDVAAGDVASFDQPTWAPDGLTIAFWVWRQSEQRSPNNGHVYRAGIDGQHLEMLTDGVGRNGDPAWSPDGLHIAFFGARPEGEGIFLISATGGRPELLPVVGVIGGPRWSPDSEWITYVSTRDGSQDIFIVRADGTEAVNLTQGIMPADHSPAWSPAALRSIPTVVVGMSWGDAKSGK